jgi:hypothetical protein
MIRNSSELSNASPTSGHDSDRGNATYHRSISDYQSQPLNEETNIMTSRFPSRTTNASTASFPVIYEVSTDQIDPTQSQTSFAPPPSASSAAQLQQQRRRSSAQGPNERQLSILDPMTDRVSTILVWQNLSVHTRETMLQEFIQTIKSYKKYVPKRKCLLSNTSGAITGGLWAVMGKCRCSFSWCCQ